VTQEAIQIMLNVVGIAAPLTVLRWRLATPTKHYDVDWIAFVLAQVILAMANGVALIFRLWS
jgi:hypothetical protein